MSSSSNHISGGPRQQNDLPSGDSRQQNEQTFGDPRQQYNQPPSGPHQDYSQSYGGQQEQYNTFSSDTYQQYPPAFGGNVVGGSFMPYPPTFGIPYQPYSPFIGNSYGGNHSLGSSQAHTHDHNFGDNRQQPHQHEKPRVSLSDYLRPPCSKVHVNTYVTLCSNHFTQKHSRKFQKKNLCVRCGSL